MKSWKARLLMVLSMLAMLAAVSVPAIAEGPGSPFDPPFNNGLDPRFNNGLDPRYAGFDPNFADDQSGDAVVDEFEWGDLDCLVLGKERQDDYGRPYLKPKRLLCLDPNNNVAVDRRI